RARGVHAGKDGRIERIGRSGRGQAAAGEQLGLDLVVYDGDGHGRVGRDVLGVGAFVRLVDGVHRVVPAERARGAERLVAAGDGIAAGDGDCIHVVAERGLDGERGGADVAIGGRF